MTLTHPSHILLLACSNRTNTKTTLSPSEQRIRGPAEETAFRKTRRDEEEEIWWLAQFRWVCCTKTNDKRNRSVEIRERTSSLSQNTATTSAKLSIGSALQSPVVEFATEATTFKWTQWRYFNFPWTVETVEQQQLVIVVGRVHRMKAVVVNCPIYSISVHYLVWHSTGYPGLEERACLVAATN